MTVTAKVLSDGKFRGKMLAIVGQAGADKLHKANQKSADEFEALVRQAIVTGPARGGHLEDTLDQYPAGEVGVAVSIGNPSLPYPLHLEVGWKAADGSHVPGRPFWYPAARIMRKRAWNRIKAAERAAIKAAVGSSSPTPGG